MMRVLCRRPALPEARQSGAQAPPIVHEVLRSPGHRLDPAVRESMERLFGHDFSRVRIHTDPSAADSARAISADAYAVGDHIVFAAGHYAPGTLVGDRLLAHELTHVRQQAGLAQTVAPRPALGSVDSPLERDAEAAAEAVLAGRTPSITLLNPAGEVGNRDTALIQRQAIDLLQTQVPPAPSPSGTRKKLDIEFHAFIPGSLGRRFDSFPHAKDLKNQAAFDAAVAGVTSPNSWKPEPMKTEADVKDPGTARKVWFFSTDERGFGGGSHRVGFKGTLDAAEIGAISGKRAIFTHSCDASHRVRSTDTGIFTSRGETGSVDGPFGKTAPAKDVAETHTDVAGSSSRIETKGSAAYAFMPILAPDIDYELGFKFDRQQSGTLDVSVSIEHNLFPFYELIVNGKALWTFSARDTGPTLTNLNSSARSSVGPISF
jgi:Domain of unknown function (DUF4157)